MECAGLRLCAAGTAQSQRSHSAGTAQAPRRHRADTLASSSTIGKPAGGRAGGRQLSRALCIMHYALWIFGIGLTILRMFSLCSFRRSFSNASGFYIRKRIISLL
jgi:hypothetical protein